MRIPSNEKDLIEFARDLVEVCTYSQVSRANQAAINLSYYESGTANSDRPSLYNRTGIHIDRTASYLYAPGDIRYMIGFDATEGEPWLERARVASKYLSREYRRADGDVTFSQGVHVGLIKGCTIMKHNWTDSVLNAGFDPQLVHPEFFGVEREDLERLEDQQAMVHTMYVSPPQVRQLLGGRDDRREIMASLRNMGADINDEELRRNWLHQIVLGGLASGNPVGTLTATGAKGTVAISPSGRTNFSPEMMQRLIRMDEIWVIDDDREDYTTIQLLEGELLLEGKYMHRNLTGVKGLHPFSRICADPVPGYFWGRSEVERVRYLQDFLTERIRDIRRLMKLQLRPPKALTGFSGVNSQKMRAALAPEGFLVEQNPNAKATDLISQIPQEAFAEVKSISDLFDEIGGFKPILQGQGEPGVRANAHARTLMRTASPKLRERALRIERDAEASADTTLRLLQAKEARVFVSQQNESFLLKQLPKDHYVEVDSHSSSPAFVDDIRELAFAYKKAGAIGNVELIQMTHPPMEDALVAAARAHDAAQAKMLQEHPELLAKKGKAA